MESFGYSALYGLAAGAVSHLTRLLIAREVDRQDKENLIRNPKTRGEFLTNLAEMPVKQDMIMGSVPLIGGIIFIIGGIADGVLLKDPHNAIAMTTFGLTQTYGGIRNNRKRIEAYKKANSV